MEGALTQAEGGDVESKSGSDVASSFAFVEVGSLPATVWARRHPDAATMFWWGGGTLFGIAFIVACSLLLGVVAGNRRRGAAIALVVIGTLSTYVAVYDGLSTTLATVVWHPYRTVRING